MPKINFRSFSMGSSASTIVERAVAENGGLYCDDPLGVLVSSIDEAVDLLRWKEPDANTFAARFRDSDFPATTIAWKQVAPSAAVVFELSQGRAEAVHLLLGRQDNGDDEAAMQVARRLFGGLFPQEGFATGGRANWVQWITLFLSQVNEGVCEPSAAVGFLTIVPIFCELCGLD